MSPSPRSGTSGTAGAAPWPPDGTPSGTRPMTPLVSIVVPAYNAEPYLADTLRSALGQTWPRVEVVVVEDGSRDGTLAVARSFEGPNVRVLSKANAGAAAARNAGGQPAQGDSIQDLDA